MLQLPRAQPTMYLKELVLPQVMRDGPLSRHYAVAVSLGCRGATVMVVAEARAFILLEQLLQRLDQLVAD